MRVRFLPLLVLAAACGEQAGPPTAPSLPSAAAVRGDTITVDARREAMARHVAMALRNPEFRAAVRAAIDTSSFDEGKVALDRFLLAPASHARQAFRESRGGQPDAAFAARLELYFPVPAHRRTWNGDLDIMVGTIGRDGDLPVAFTPEGSRVVLDREVPPATPVLAVVPRETDFDAHRAPAVAFATCTTCDGGTTSSGGSTGGTGSSGSATTSGLYLTQSHLNSTFESWLKGKPEIEIMALGQKGTTDSLTTYQCDNEHAAGPYYINQDSKDWSGSTLLLSQSQIDNFKVAHPDQALRLFFVEDDDTPCVIKASGADLKSLFATVDSIVKGLAGGRDATTWLGKAWKYFPVVQQVASVAASLIKSNDDLIGNAVEDIVAAEPHAGYNWVIKGKNGETNGYIALEMR